MWCLLFKPGEYSKNPGSYSCVYKQLPHVVSVKNAFSTFYVKPEISFECKATLSQSLDSFLNVISFIITKIK